MYSHVSYDVNFAIFTGWCNPVLNFATAFMLAPTNEAWIWVLLAWALLPFLTVVIGTEVMGRRSAARKSKQHSV